MNFIYMSKDKARQLTAKVPYIMISITDEHPVDDFCKDKNRLDILPISFSDFDIPGFPDVISFKQASEIVKFAENYKHKTELIVAHCEAGISRSPAVLLGISIRWNIRMVLPSPCSPNPPVVHRILNFDRQLLLRHHDRSPHHLLRERCSTRSRIHCFNLHSHSFLQR